MRTDYQIIPVEGPIREGHIEWPREPHFQMIKDFVQPLIQTDGHSHAYLEHVRVWHNGIYCSLFVDDMGSLKRLPVNEAATRVYHANMLANMLDSQEVQSMPPIHGPAVLFLRNVWY